MMRKVCLVTMKVICDNMDVGVEHRLQKVL